MTEDEFIEQAETGDLLLLRYNGKMAKISGIATGYFNHAALVVNTKFMETIEPNVGFYEAVQTGVKCGWWTDLKANLGPGKTYEKICLRKLTMFRDEEFNEKVNTFV